LGVNLKVCFVGEYNPDAVINATTKQMLEKNNVKINSLNAYKKTFIWPKKLSKLVFLLNVLKQKNTDLLYIPFHPGNYPFVLKIFSIMLRKPLVMDFLISPFLNMKYEFQGYEELGPFREKIDFWKDKMSLHFADLVLVDTVSSKLWYSKTFNIQQEKFHVKTLGASTDIFKPLAFKNSAKKFNVLYFLSYRPLHNVFYVLRAAKKLSNYNVHFILVGDGLAVIKNAAIQYVKNKKIKNVEFVEWVSLKRIKDFLADCDVCLGGPFGIDEKSSRVMTQKTFIGLASQRPVIVGNTPQHQIFFKGNEDAIVFVDIKNPDSLAKAIIDLKKNKKKRKEIAKKGYVFFKENFSLEKIGYSLKKRFELLIAQNKKK